jgi:hypothetical protein
MYCDITARDTRAIFSITQMRRARFDAIIESADLKIELTIDGFSSG